MAEGTDAARRVASIALDGNKATIMFEFRCGCAARVSVALPADPSAEPLRDVDAVVQCIGPDPIEYCPKHSGKAAEALGIDPEEVGRIMHASWTRTKRAQGFHGPGERCPHGGLDGDAAMACKFYHADLTPWEELPEAQKDINRHAFDDVLAELRRRANHD